MDSTPSTPGAESPSVTPVPEDDKLDTVTADAGLPDSEEGLPEFEPLTPELVEDEAIRGDFMLRWAAVLLAVLLGWTEITETLTLVRIKTGDYMLSHGFLPPRTDVFSASAEGRPWRNLSWLGDLLLSGVHGLGGDAGLTVLAAVLAGISIWCVTASARSGVSSWWGSICAVLATIAAFPLLRPGPDSITILGLSAVMLVLAKGEERPERARYVLLIPLLLLWGNLDGHAFIGAAVLLAYAIGDVIDGRREVFKSGASMWVFGVAAVLAMVLNPFHIHVFKSPLMMYVVEAEEQLLYGVESDQFHFLWRRLLDRDVWVDLNVFTLAGLLTAFAALVSMGLNYRQLRVSHVLVFLALCGLALASAQALAAGSVVFAVLAGVNAQEWYRRGFRQTYSVETAELIFSRGGRALTVVGLFAVAYLAVSGRLMGAEGRRVGMGFHPSIESAAASLQELLADSFNDRGFNFNLEQGDVLIWVGHKPFVDSRLSLYAGEAPNLAQRHRDLRLAMLQRIEGNDRTGQRDVWHEAFKEYDITHALPRLSGRRPNYETFFDLLTDPQQEWRLAKLGAATATLYWHRPDDAELAKYLANHPGADFLRAAFPRSDTPEDPELPTSLATPQPPSWYDRMLILPRTVIPNDVQLARHYVQLQLVLSGRVSQDYSAALNMLAIRHARRGLAVEPNSAQAYQALAACYLSLSELEQYLDGGGQGAIGQLRMRQALTALHFAVRCDPDDAPSHMTLFRVLLAAGKPDMAVRHLQEVMRINGEPTVYPAGTEAAQQDAEQNRELLTQLTTQIEKVRNELRLSLASETGRLEVIQAALSRGMPGEALRLLEEDQTVIAQNSAVQMVYAELLQDEGRIEDGLTQLEPMSNIMLRQSPTVASSWRYTTAVANIAAGNYERGSTLMKEDADAATAMRLQSVLGMSPEPGQAPGLSTVPFTHTPEFALEMRALTRATLMTDLLGIYPQQWDRNLFIIAMCDIENGRNHAAVDRMQELLKIDPESAFRPTLAFYLSMMSGEPVTFLPPSQDIPVWPGMFADDSETGPPLPNAAPSGSEPDASTEDATTDEPAAPPPPPASQRSTDGN